MQPFAYAAPTELDDVLESLGVHGTDAKVLAGGQSLLVMLRQRLLAPAVLIDVKRVTAMAGLSVTEGSLVVGATVRHAELAGSPVVTSGWPMLSTAAGSIGSPHIRNRGTIGGSIAHADPAADLLVALIALEGVVQIQSSTSSMTLAAEDFATGVFETLLSADSVITSVRVPGARPGSTHGYARFSLRDGEFPMCQAAVALTWTDGTCNGARVVMGGSAERPIRLPSVEAGLIGATSDTSARDRAIAVAGRSVAADVRPFPDVRGSAAWKARVAATVVERALRQALMSGSSG